MFSSAGDFEVDQEKSAARAAAPTSLFPFFANPAMALAANAARLPVATTSAATSSPSATPNISTTFPTMMHTAFFQQMLQAMQFNRQPGALAAATPDSNNGSMVESRSSSTTGSPSTTKRLQTDKDGNPICPVCSENIGGENNWRAHVELEKKKLAQMVESLKAQRSSPFDVHNIMNMSYSQAAEKREKELQRIRSNQEKRLRAKNTVFTLSHLKDDKHSYTSATTEEVLDSRSGSTSSQHFGDLEKSYCKGCERQQEFLVLSNMLDEPRCMDCFQKRRQQIGGLPSTITQSPDEACKEDRTLSTPSRSNRTTPSSSTTSPINGRSSVTENGHVSPLASRIKEELTPEVPEKRQRLDLLA